MRALVLIISLLAGVAGLFFVRETAAAPAASLTFHANPISADRADRTGVDVVKNPANLDLKSIGARWYMNYTDLRDPSLSAEFVPLVCGYPGRSRFNPAKLSETREWLVSHRGDYPKGTIFLVGNEIGHYGGTESDGRSPSEYAADFHDCYAMLKQIDRTFRVSVGPAILSKDPNATKGQISGDGLTYLREVIDSYKQQFGQVIPADYFAATSHVVPPSLYNHVLDVGKYKEQVRELRTELAEAGLRDRDVIITEVGDPFRGGSVQHAAEFMDATFHFLADATDPETGCPSDGNHLVQRWAWYLAAPLSLWEELHSLGGAFLVLNLSQTSLFDADGRPDYLGRVYAELTNAPLENSGAIKPRTATEP